METNESKSQKEVWEWKESLFEELKNIPKESWLKFIKEKTKNTLQRFDKTSSKIHLV
jgi:hypothetical protein